MSQKLLLPTESRELMTSEFLRDFIKRFADEALEEVSLTSVMIGFRDFFIQIFP